MGNSFHKYGRARRRRERMVIASAVGGMLVLFVLLPGVIAYVRGRVSEASELVDATVGSVGEAAGVLETLGENPSDEKLIEAIKDRDMPGRRMGIEMLGEGGHGQALPVLRSIVRDTTDVPDHRVAALEAINLIAHHEAVDLAEQYQDDKALENTARLILTDDSSLRNKRSRVKTLHNLIQ